MSRQKTRITEKMRKLGMAWATTDRKHCSPNDSLEDQAAGRKTYHVHPDVSYPHQNHIKRFGSLRELNQYLSDIEAAQEAEARGDRAAAEFIMSVW